MHSVYGIIIEEFKNRNFAYIFKGVFTVMH